MTTQTLLSITKQRSIRFLGIEWRFHPRAWIFLLVRMGVGMAVALLAFSSQTLSANLVQGVLFGVLFLIAEGAHLLGHILTDRVTRPDLNAVQINALSLDVDYCDQEHDVPPYVQLVRAWGGPLISTLVGTGCLLLWLNVGGQSLLFFAAINKALFAINLLPIAPLDGAIIWRETPRVFRPQR